ncbi:hypothetical protein FG739_020530 [Salmonella enterica subsp. enterica serovar Derby]|nr:hypothetical protein FG742_021660 [Salmonella enterica subsp. enterica serovar Derby]TRF74775.1 hypothetical protein FG739_020530 [Salmonella enterica subsp. enterica serovar Derby]TSF44138.1 hypothetical protein FG733_21450 [Salmonella enterica subsp. enterica serovar Derby]
MCIHLNLMIFTKIIRGFISTRPQPIARSICATELPKIKSKSLSSFGLVSRRPAIIAQLFRI